ncbi:MAG TPA: LysM peptidoglycan-binding domain-containing protein, partial [Pseudomonadales bacterium]|nr:LysM peptidoglycan-binding domain-containing protein [Pseudomonadales bacterium]
MMRRPGSTPMHARPRSALRVRLAPLAALLLLNACAVLDTPAGAQADRVPGDPVRADRVQADRAEVPAVATTVEVPAIAPTVVWTAAPVEQDLWARLRQGYGLPDPGHDRVAGELRWFARHPDYMGRVANRAERYLFHVVTEIEARGLPTELALLPIVESAYDPWAYSHGRAAGLWQFIPGTGRMYALDQDWWHDERRDVLESTRAALDHLEDLHRMFDGDWLLALAAYNSGSGNVRRALRRNREAGLPLDFFSLDLPRETEAYVPKLLAISALVGDPEAYGLTMAPMPDEPYFEVVDIGTQLDLARAATLAGVEGEELYLLNPGLNRWATHPEGPHRLLVPVGHGDDLRDGIAGLAADQRVTWERHRIRPGETLSTIAARYGTDVATLQHANRLRGSAIRAGNALLIPTASAPAETYAMSTTQRQASRDARNGEDRRAIHHAVAPGESFWTIARRHGVDMHRLASWNGMAVRDPLPTGKDLVIWKSPASPLAAAAADITARDPVVRKLGYQVRSGDSLARIASRFGVSVSDIVSWNALNPARYLQPGQRLTLFVDIV